MDDHEEAAEAALGASAGAGAGATESETLSASLGVVSLAIAIGVPIGSGTSDKSGTGDSLLADAGSELAINCMATGSTYEAMRGLLVSNLAAAALAFAADGDTGDSGDNGDEGLPREVRGDGGSRICKRCKLLQPLMRGDTGGSEFGRVAGDFGTAWAALALVSQACEGVAQLDAVDRRKLTLRYRARGDASEGVEGKRMHDCTTAATFSWFSAGVDAGIAGTTTGE